MSNRVKVERSKTVRRRNGPQLAQCADRVPHLPHGWWPPGIFAALSRCPGLPTP